MRRTIRNVRHQIDRLRGALRVVGQPRKSRTVHRRHALLSALQIGPFAATRGAMDPGSHGSRQAGAGVSAVRPVVEEQVLPKLGSRSAGTRSGDGFEAPRNQDLAVHLDNPQNRGEGDYRGRGLAPLGDGNATSASPLRSDASGDEQYATRSHSLRSFDLSSSRTAHRSLRLVVSSDLREGYPRSTDPGDHGTGADAQGDPRERRMSSTWETLRIRYQAYKTISRLTGRAVWVHAGGRSGGSLARTVRTARNMLLQSSIISLASRSLQDRFPRWGYLTHVPLATNRLAPAKLATAVASWMASKVWP